MLSNLRKKYISIILLFIILSTISSLVFIKTHILFSADDMEFHVKRIIELQYLIKHGSLLPGYSFNFFHGSALMKMYPYYSLLPFLLIHEFIGSFIGSYYCFFDFIVLVSLLSCFFSSLKFSKSLKISLMFAIVYSMSSPMVMMMFTNGDLGLVTSTAFLPLAIFGFIDLINGYNNYPKLASGLALMLYCQIPSFIITFGFLIIWFLINLVFSKHYKNILNFVKAILIFGLLTNIIWLPLIHVYIFNNINSVYIPHYLSDINIKEFVKYISIPSIIAIIISFSFFKKFNNILKQMYILSIIIIIFLSIMPWKVLIYKYNVKILKIFNVFQFPYRFLIIPQIFLCYIFSFDIIKWMSRYNGRNKLIIYTSVTLFVVLLQFLSQGYLINRRNNQNKISINNIHSTKIAFVKNKRYVIKRNSDIKYLINGYIDMHDYFPRSSMKKIYYINNNEGISNNDGLIKIHHIGNNKFSFNTNKGIRSLELPLLKYNKEHLYITLNGHHKHYEAKNNIINIKNVQKGNNHLTIYNPGNHMFMSIKIFLWLIGILWIGYYYLYKNKRGLY